MEEKAGTITYVAVTSVPSAGFGGGGWLVGFFFFLWFLKVFYGCFFLWFCSFFLLGRCLLSFNVDFAWVLDGVGNHVFC